VLTALPHWSLRWPLRRPIAAALYSVQCSSSNGSQ